jgi:hypothetical protein
MSHIGSLGASENAVSQGSQMNQIATIASVPSGAVTLLQDDLDAAGVFLAAEKSGAT